MRSTVPRRLGVQNQFRARVFGIGFRCFAAPGTNPIRARKGWGAGEAGEDKTDKHDSLRP